MDGSGDGLEGGFLDYWVAKLVNGIVKLTCAIVIYIALLIVGFVYFLTRLVALACEMGRAHRRGYVEHGEHNLLFCCANYEDYRNEAWKLDDKKKRSRSHTKHRKKVEQLYDHQRLTSATLYLKAIRDGLELKEKVKLLQPLLKTNFCNISDERLFTSFYQGTEPDIEAYVVLLHRKLQSITEELELKIRAEETGRIQRPNERRRADAGDLLEQQQPNEQEVEDAGDLVELEKVMTDFVNTTRATWGRTAIILSGGAAIGMHHFGVGRVLLDADMLPEVWSGASAGSIISAMFCVYTDMELYQLIDREVLPHVMKCFNTTGTRARIYNYFNTRFNRLLREKYGTNGGHMFDAVLWQDRISKIFGSRRLDSGEWEAYNICTPVDKDENSRKVLKDRFGDKGLLLEKDLPVNITFKEAFKRTGRILNISVSNQGNVAGPVILNHSNAPDIVVWSAVLCSAAFPLLIPKQPLMYKKGGEIGNWSFSIPANPVPITPEYYQDGSIDCDIPTLALAEQWRVQHSIVVQLNPHVFPFLSYRPRGAAGQPATGEAGWRGCSLVAILSITLLEILRALGRALAFIDALWPVSLLLDVDLSRLVLQEYSGTLITTPQRLTIWHLFFALSDMEGKVFDWFWHHGHLMAWPKMTAISHRMIIDKSIRKLRQQSRRLSTVIGAPRDPEGESFGVWAVTALKKACASAGPPNEFFLRRFFSFLWLCFAHWVNPVLANMCTRGIVETQHMTVEGRQSFRELKDEWFFRREVRETVDEMLSRRR